MFPKVSSWDMLYKCYKFTLTSFPVLLPFIVVVLITSAFIPACNGLANCPNGCECDDDTLVVKCGVGTLDVLPIALNPSIQRLVIKNNKIKTIDSSIQFYAELTFLDLSHNHLVTIPPRTFGYQKKLQELHLNHNKIGKVSNKTFIGLALLTVLNLRGNLLAELEQGTFAPITKIVELNLGQNRINYIDLNAFIGMTNLRVLYLDDNTLTTMLPSSILKGMPNLAELFLGTNSFMTTPPKAFQNLKGLTRLDLRGAGLHNISQDSFEGLDGLRFLDLSDNRFQRVPTIGMSHLERLEELSLGQNDFEILMEGAFAGLKNLRHLEIYGAQRLRRVANGAFATNANLEYLNLSANKFLVLIEEGAFNGLPHLRHVILKENALNTLAEGLFPWEDLETLELSDNPIECDCRVLWLRNLLVSRNTSSNSISRVLCAFPERLRNELLQNLTPGRVGCSHNDPKKQVMICALLVGSAAIITACALIMYKCRRKIRELLKGGWGNSALGRKEREYQKTFAEEDYMSRHSNPCTLGINSTFHNVYKPHHPQQPGQEIRTIPVTEL